MYSSGQGKSWIELFHAADFYCAFLELYKIAFSYLKTYYNGGALLNGQGSVSCPKEDSAEILMV